MRKPWKDTPDTPWWVWVLTDCGRPVMTFVVLILCAPGEQYLARLAGWSPVLSWGMASLLAAYAGIAAVIATRRPTGARGKKSAVVGAGIALVLAMVAQPVAHLFVTGWLTASPRTPWELVVVVSSVPPLVLGHLLHLAASPDRVSAAGRRTASPAPRSVSAPAVRPSVPALPQQSADRGQTVPAASAPTADMSVSLDKTMSVPTDTDGQSNVSQIGQAHGLAALVRHLYADGLSDEDIRAEVLRQLPDTKTDTLGKTIRRVRGARHARTA